MADTNYRGYVIQAKEDFGGKPFLLRGRDIGQGFVAMKGGTNAMPGAIWFESEAEAQFAIDILERNNGDSLQFWKEFRERQNERCYTDGFGITLTEEQTTLLAQIMEGLQVPLSVGGGLMLGTATKPFMKLRESFKLFGYQEADEIEREMRKHAGGA